MQAVTEAAVSAFRIIAWGTLLVVVVKCALDLWRVKEGRGVTVLKGCAALAVWGLVSGGTKFMLAEAIFSSTQVDAPGGGGPAGVAALVIIYAVACGGLSYWVLRRAEA